jgi:hypothetical protein
LIWLRFQKKILSNNSSLEISEEEEALVGDSLVNTKWYENAVSGKVTRFFDTIQNYGGPQLKPLLQETTDGNLGKERKIILQHAMRREGKAKANYCK